MPYIYFIHETGEDAIFKMGKTANHPVDRLKQLQTGNPRKLLVYRYIKVDDHSSAEDYLHCKYSEFHIHGEWYNISRSVVDEECELISSNIAGSSVSGTYEAVTWEQRNQIKIDNAKKKGDDKRARKLAKKMERLALSQGFDNIIGFSDEV